MQPIFPTPPVSFDTVVLLVMVFGPFLVSLAAFLFHLLLDHLPSSQQQLVRQIISEVVAAVEQANQDVPGQEKKAVAQDLVGVLLHQARLSATPEQVDVLIEAAVGALHAALPQKLPAASVVLGALAPTPQPATAPIPPSPPPAPTSPPLSPPATASDIAETPTMVLPVVPPTVAPTS